MTAFGNLIRQWRNKRHLSQLTLAADTGTTSRHVSFLETGRSRPSEDMILRLSTTLKIPFRERNILFRAAGFQNKYKETGLDHEDMHLIKSTIQRMLKYHEPYPATVIDRHWNIIDMNKTFRIMLESLTENISNLNGPSNILELLFHAKGARHKIVNWEVVARQLIQRIHRESFEDSDAEEQINRLRAISDLPDNWWHVDIEKATQPILSIQIETPTGQVAKFFSLISSFGTPIDVTAQEMRIELCYPADDATSEIFKQMSNS